MTEIEDRLIDQGGAEFAELLRKVRRSRRVENFGTLRCATCKERRAMDLHWHGETVAGEGPLPGSVQFEPPGLGRFECRQCGDNHYAGMFFPNPGTSGGRVEILLIGSFVSIATPNTPRPVAYYLNEAAASKSVQARSAAAAMFRSALEHILFDQGFKTGMLAQKLAALEKAVGENTAPPWAAHLDPLELNVLKEIGNGAIHPNDGDVARQAAIDNEVIESIETVLEHTLDLIYEAPLRKAKRLALLGAAAAVVTPPRPPKV